MLLSRVPIGYHLVASVVVAPEDDFKRSGQSEQQTRGNPSTKEDTNRTHVD